MKKKPLSYLARSRKRHTRFRENLAGKSDFASPEDKQDSESSDNSVCVKVLETDSLTSGSNKDPGTHS